MVPIGAIWPSPTHNPHLPQGIEFWCLDKHSEAWTSIWGLGLELLTLDSHKNFGPWTRLLDLGLRILDLGFEFWTLDLDSNLVKRALALQSESWICHLDLGLVI